MLPPDVWKSTLLAAAGQSAAGQSAAGQSAAGQSTAGQSAAGQSTESGGTEVRSNMAAATARARGGWAHYGAQRAVVGARLLRHGLPTAPRAAYSAMGCLQRHGLPTAPRAAYSATGCLQRHGRGALTVVLQNRRTTATGQ